MGCTANMTPERGEWFSFDADYRPGQTVTVIALERPGRVELVRVDQGGHVDYYVAFWNDGKRCQEWLPGRELAVRDEELCRATSRGAKCDLELGHSGHHHWETV